MKLEAKALRVIDMLVSDDLSENSCCKVAFNRKFTQKEARALSDKITQIYTISHSAIPEHSCYEVHENWRRETRKLFKQLEDVK